MTKQLTFFFACVSVAVAFGANARQPDAAKKKLASQNDYTVANNALECKVTVVNIPWSFPSNRIDWLFNPTKKKGPFNPEWTWQLNRMYFWESMAKVYRDTGDERYAQAFARQLESWLEQTGGVPPKQNYNAVGSAFRTIEQGLRLMSFWPTVWEKFGKSPAFTDELKRRFIDSMRAQANHLIAHKTRANWLLMEMNGVHSFACLFPDFPESARLRQESAKIFCEAISKQVLPDGLQDELSPDYHCVYYSCASGLYLRSKKYGFEDEISREFKSLLEKSAEATLALTTPAFVQPRFNDCFTVDTARVLSRAAKIFPEREDFRWGATHGREGNPPAGEVASRIFPYSGFAAMRSGWHSDAAYMAFDFGPLGMAHSHQDKLGFTLWKGNQEFIFDDGGGQYEQSPMRAYAISGYDHNVLLVDGLAQRRKAPLRVQKPIIESDWQSDKNFDRVKGVYDQGFGPKSLNLAIHRREIEFDKRAEIFRVTDFAESRDGKDHEWSLLFHLNARNVKVAPDKRSLRTLTGGKWDLQLELCADGEIALAVSGQRKPTISGWFVGRTNEPVRPATTVTVKAKKSGKCKFITVLKFIPTEKPANQ